MNNVLTEKDRAARYNTETAWSGNDAPQVTPSHTDSLRARFAAPLAAWERLLPDLSPYRIFTEIALLFEIDRRRSQGVDISKEDADLLIKAWRIRDYI